jgi:hypothetical protein
MIDAGGDHRLLNQFAPAIHFSGTESWVLRLDDRHQARVEFEIGRRHFQDGVTVG